MGVFIGLALGLALAVGVAFYLSRAGVALQQPVRDAVREPGKAARAEPSPAEKPRFDFYRILPGIEEPKIQAKSPERVTPDRATVERAASPDKAAGRPEDRAPAAKAEDKPAGAKAGEKSAVAKAEDKPASARSEDKPTVAKSDDRAARPTERYWLQAGSFNNEADAENLKARLAFAGWEATVLPATLPDKSTRYRVRIGPYDNTDELNRMKGELAGRGFDVAVIRN